MNIIQTYKKIYHTKQQKSIILNTIKKKIVAITL